MSDVKVIVKDERGQTTSETTTNKAPNTAQQAGAKADPKNNSAKENKKSSQGLAVASMVASRSFSYATSNVGKWTGNSRNQDTMNMIQQGVGIGAAAYINPWLAVAMVAIQIGTTAIDAAFTNGQETLKSNVRKLRAGYTENNQIIGGRK